MVKKASLLSGTHWTQESPVKTTDVSHPEWKLLRELVLSARAEGIAAWLEETLEPLGLSADLRTRLLNSAQEAVLGIMQPNSAGLNVGQIHFVILVQADPSLKGKTWGFFRIEKMDGLGKDHNSLDHSIEFYLYLDV